MPLRVGFHLEGWDYLILRALLARLLDRREEEIEADQVDLSNRGWQSILQAVPQAMRRFYYGGMHLALVGVDNDGNHDLVKTGKSEDPQRPRHWNHDGEHLGCRQCRLLSLVEATRRQLKDLPYQAAATWPVLTVVPVESIEAWLLTLQALEAGRGGVYFENQLRQALKMRLYGRPIATKNDVETIALPMIQAATVEHLNDLRGTCKSFELFVAALDAARTSILVRLSAGT